MADEPTLVTRMSARGGAVGDAALVDEERQQRGHRALRHVGARVPGGEDREAAAVERAGAHRAATPSSAMRSTPSRARSGSQPWPRRRWR